MGQEYLAALVPRTCGRLLQLDKQHTTETLNTRRREKARCAIALGSLSAPRGLGQFPLCNRHYRK
jgi:hypothetical protein